MIQKKDFYIDNINVYNDNNVLLSKGDDCYFLVSNDVDYHVKLLFSGHIESERWAGGMTKTFVIRPIECFSSIEDQRRYLYHKPFTVQRSANSSYVRRVFNVFTDSDPSKWSSIYFRVNSFFTRPYSQKGHDSITTLLKEYHDFIVKDLSSRIDDITKTK